ncbi:PREDICTED: DNA polymerase delta subunit 3-like [Dufourea novaeangliae]|nr:PREDICTED: DNA polymerase delta subunit 3-like [Dufourea novaeangliae]
MESLDEYLETVAGYIFDNDKLVTYKWLSKELEVHVNIAKQILWEFWERNKNEKTFDCTFLIMGILENGGISVEVVKEKDLLKAKEKFTQIVSEHVYSLQKMLSDIQVLGLAETGDIRYSAIKCFENNERSAEEMHVLRWGSASKEIQLVPQETAKSVPEPVKEKEERSPEKKLSDTKKNNQKKGFNNLFGKVGNKQKSPSSASSKTDEVDRSNQTKQSPKKSAAESSKKNAQKGGLGSFLQQGKNQVKSANAVSSETKEVEEKVAEKATFKSKDSKKEITRGKKRNRSKEGSSATKKRKRIAVLSDSSESESDEVQENPPSPSPEKVSPVRIRSPSPPKVKLDGGKRKVLKMVDKTFEEDGYLVTKKVHVYESVSEDEPEEKEPKKSVTPESRPEPKGKKITKQTTLMNFFKKS